MKFAVNISMGPIVKAERLAGIAKYAFPKLNKVLRNRKTFLERTVI